MPQASQPVRAKHIPQRTCVACRTVAGKRGLIRLVRTAEGVRIDPSGKMAGRGAYLHPLHSCWQRALSGRYLEQALRVTIGPEDRAALEQYMDQLPAQERGAGDA